MSATPSQSEHAADLVELLKKLKVDYSLLLLLTAPKHVISPHGCASYLDNMYFQMVLDPFCRGLIKLVEASEDVSKGMLEYCRVKSSEFVRSPSECLAGLRALCEPCLSEALLSELDSALHSSRPKFENFFRTVSADIEEFVPSIDPGKYLCCFTKKGVMEKYANSKSKWGQHNPSLFQTYDMEETEGKPVVAKGSSVFVIFRNPSDAIHAVAGYLMDGKIGVPDDRGRTSFRKVMGVNELYMPGALCNFILDCEMPVSFYGGRLTAEAIRGSMDRFVAKLLNFWATSGILPEEGFVGVAVKDKSRPLSKPDSDSSGDFKVSIHAVPSIIATRDVHNAAQKRFLEARDAETGRTHRELIGLAKDAARQNQGVLPEGFALTDLEFWDHSAGKSNGIAAQFSKKRQGDPYSTFYGTDVYLAGAKVDEERCAIGTPHDPRSLTKEEVMQILWQLCSSTPKYVTDKCYPAAYTEEFCKSALVEVIQFIFTCLPPLGFEPIHPGRWGQVGGGAAKTQATPEGVAVGSSSSVTSPSHLQGWPVSVLRQLSGREGEVRSAPDGYPKIRSTLPPSLAEKAEIVCYSRGVCAHDFASGGIAKGTPKHHDGNGVYVAYTMAPPVVYLTCTTGGAGHRITSARGEDDVEYCKVINRRSRVMEDGTVEPVEKVAPDFVHWVMLGKEELDLLAERRGAATGTCVLGTMFVVQSTLVLR